MPAQRTQLPECANNEVRSRNAKPKADKPAKIGCMWTGISFKRLIRDGSPVSVPQRCGLFPCCGGREEHDKTMHLTGTQWETIWHPIYNSCGLRMAVSCCAAQPKSNAFLSFFFYEQSSHACFLTSHAGSQSWWLTKEYDEIKGNRQHMKFRTMACAGIVSMMMVYYHS